ncbi:MAG: GNAT family N-acetyltransferase [Anaerolineae bacterium]|nr:GNAT family N-acetyltransferase [Anaerolineae bacterium]
MTVTLRPITKDNWMVAIKLKVKPEQAGFVASNVFSIAERQFYPDVRTQGIYVGEDMVGFVMWGVDVDDNPTELWVWRLMIDAAHQGQGYANTAMLIVIAQARAEGHTALFLSYEPENEDAAAFYAKLDFKATGRVEYGEKVVRLALVNE